ncbi:glycoside hydrolase family 6 protein [Mycolicibacterium psychrotolerans]|uniref:glycoside hydrolase family 6 protein n=1 Tax=Mycolicibacterium psychrotolerans TaxID=216929 RepID=UPI003D677A78
MSRLISSWWRRVKRGEKRAVLASGAAAVVATLLAIVAVGCSGQRHDGADFGAIEGSTPVNTTLYRDPQMHAIAAAREDSRFDPIAETPQAKWLSDWSTTASVRHDIRDYLWGAALANAIPTIVLYRIPHLDCGGPVPGQQVYTGARDEREYKDWVDGAAAALMGHNEAIVILEPDALPQLGDCDQGDRVGMLRHAVDKLSATGARVYIDAGHENWLTAAEAADRLNKLGVDKVAGFSLNVSNFNPTKGEVRYAESVRIELSKLGVTDAHYLIDIGRNGAGTQDSTCNPPGARLGHAPALYYGGALDGLLWVKNPGETDGSACRGGPEVGFWPAAALGLLGLDGTQATGTRSATGWIVLSITGVAALAAVVGFAVGKKRRNGK